MTSIGFTVYTCVCDVAQIPYSVFDRQNVSPYCGFSHGVAGGGFCKEMMMRVQMLTVACAKVSGWEWFG